MPNPTCQLNLTLDVPTAEAVEDVAFPAHYRPSGAGKILLQERLALAAAGWKIDDKEMSTMLEAICRMKAPELEKVKSLLISLGALSRLG